MIVDREIDAVIRAGVFWDRQHAVNEALETLFAVRPQLRTEAAVQMFRLGSSISRTLPRVCSCLKATPVPRHGER